MTFDEWDALVDAAAPAPLGTGRHRGRPRRPLLHRAGRPAGRRASRSPTATSSPTRSTRRSPAGCAQSTCSSPPGRSSTSPAPRPCCRWSGWAARSSCCPAFDAAACLDIDRAHGVTVYMPVPTMLAALAAEQRARPRDVSSLRLIGHAGSPITTAVIRDAHETFPDAELEQYYGATETASIVTCLAHEERLLDGGPLGSVGQPVVGVAVDVLDADGPTVPARATAGEVVAARTQRHRRLLGGRRRRPRRRSSTAGTGRATSATSTTTATCGCSTGSKDMIVTGGENVYSIEVEEVLARHPAVRRVRGLRRPRRAVGRGRPRGRRRRRAEQVSDALAERTARPLPGVDRRLQGAQADRAAHRPAAQVRSGQGAEAPAPRALLGRVPAALLGMAATCKNGGQSWSRPPWRARTPLSRPRRSTACSDWLRSLSIRDSTSCTPASQAREQAPALGGQPRLEDPSVVRMGAAPHEAHAARGSGGPRSSTAARRARVGRAGRWTARCGGRARSTSCTG